MSVMNRLRAYHALLAILSIAAYLTAETGLIHAWLGYGVAAVIVLRLLMALTGAPQLGLMRFYPQFEGLKLGNALTHPMISRTILLGIAACVVGVALTGIALDGGRAIGLASGEQSAQSAQSATPVYGESDEAHEREEGGKEEGPLGEAHEFLANLLVVLVGAHVTYLLIFKRPLARFMLFAGAKKKPDQ